MFAAAVDDLGTAVMSMRHGRDELLGEITSAREVARTATVNLEQTRDQSSVTNSKLTGRIQSQADDVRVGPDKQLPPHCHVIKRVLDPCLVS